MNLNVRSEIKGVGDMMIDIDEDDDVNSVLIKISKMVDVDVKFLNLGDGNALISDTLISNVDVFNLSVHVDDESIAIHELKAHGLTADLDTFFRCAGTHGCAYEIVKLFVRIPNMLTDKINDINILQHCVKHNKIKYVELLIELGMDVNVRNVECRTLIHLCARDNMWEVMNVLISHGADINSTDVIRCTPLSAAVRSNSLECVKILLDCDGIRLFGLDGANRSALTVSMVYGCTEITNVIRDVYDKYIVMHLDEAETNKSLIEHLKYKSLFKS